MHRTFLRNPDSIQKFRSTAYEFIVLFAIVSNGLSQVLFNLIINNRGAIVWDIRFLVNVLFWFLILPVLFLWGLDRVLAKTTPTRLFRIWRAVLYTLLFLSLFQQFKILYPGTYHVFLSFLPPLLLYVLISVAFFLATLFMQRFIHQSMAVFGMIGLVLTCIFIYEGVKGSYLLSTNEGIEKHSLNRNPDATSVVFVIFDELSLDELMENNEIKDSYPNFKALSKDSLWFRNATSNHWTTNDSLPSLFTGTIFPEKNQTTLFQYLPQETVTVSVTELWVENWLRASANSRIDQYRGKAYFLNKDPFLAARYLFLILKGVFFETKPEINVNVRSFHTTLPAELGGFLAHLSPLKASEFLLWHSSLSHSPFIFNRDGTDRGDSDSYFPPSGFLRIRDYQNVRQSYQEQIGYADRILGRIMTTMKEQGSYDKAILVVAADHGLRLWGKLFSDVDLVARVPVMIRAPGGETGASTLDFQLIDLAPTLLDLLKIDYTDGTFEGISAFRDGRSRRQKVIYVESRQFVFDSESSRWKQVQDRQGDSVNLQEAFSNSYGQEERLFSSVQLMEDLYKARETKEDFLEIYMARHFPFNAGEEEIQSLRKRMEDLRKRPDSPSVHFQRGVNYFFLAVWETYSLSVGEEENMEEMDRFWRASVEELRMAGDLEMLLADEIEKLLIRSDTDGGGMSRPEWIHMMRSRTSIE